MIWNDVVSNVKVYGLEDSMRAARYPMSVDAEGIISAEELEYWNQDNFLERFIYEKRDNNKYVLEDGYAKLIIGEYEVLLDEEDIPKVFDYEWKIVNAWDETPCCYSGDIGRMMEYQIFNPPFSRLDNNKLDNRRSNFMVVNDAINKFNGYCRLKDAISLYKTIHRLAKTPGGAGEDQALTGITVQFDLTCSNKMWVEAERYRFLYFVSLI